MIFYYVAILAELLSCGSDGTPGLETGEVTGCLGCAEILQVPSPRNI